MIVFYGIHAIDAICMIKREQDLKPQVWHPEEAFETTHTDKKS